MKLWIIASMLVLLAVGGFFAVNALQDDMTNVLATTGCGKCNGSCTTESNCGNANCGALTEGECQCNSSGAGCGSCNRSCTSASGCGQSGCSVTTGAKTCGCGK